MRGGYPPPEQEHLQWRTAPTYYREGNAWPSGSWLAKPAGYALGHQVRHTSHFPASAISALTSLSQTPSYTPRPSPSLRHQTGQAWAEAMAESGALLSAILRIAHPALYRAGISSLQVAAQDSIARSALDVWPTVFNAVQVISNRQTPFHRDNAGMPAWLDLLMSLGSCRRATIVLRNLGMQMAYNPGSLALISSFLIHHGVAEVPADRICYSWFMTEVLHVNLGIPEVSWASRSVSSTASI